MTDAEKILAIRDIIELPHDWIEDYRSNVMENKSHAVTVIAPEATIGLIRKTLRGESVILTRCSQRVATGERSWTYEPIGNVVAGQWSAQRDRAALESAK